MKIFTRRLRDGKNSVRANEKSLDSTASDSAVTPCLSSGISLGEVQGLLLAYSQDVSRVVRVNRQRDATNRPDVETKKLTVFVSFTVTRVVYILTSFSPGRGEKGGFFVARADISLGDLEPSSRRDAGCSRHAARQFTAICSHS